MQATEPKLYNLNPRMIELYKTLLDCFIKRNIINSHSDLPHQIHVKDPQNCKSWALE
jgi:hypothetical protein